MAVRIQETTKDDLVAVPVPQYFKGQVLAHKFIMDYMEEKLLEAGHSIEEEVYRATADGGIAQCIYKLGNGKLVAWTNSYMQGMRFKCGSGIYFKEGACMIADLEPALTRKVDVDVRVKSEIDIMIANLNSSYNASVEMLKEMRKVDLHPDIQGELLGLLFGTHKNLTSEQAAIVARSIKNDHRAMSVVYHDVATALKRSHPKAWMDDHRTLNSVFHNKLVEYLNMLEKDLTTLEVELEPDAIDPNQVNMLDQIEEMEQTIGACSGPQPDVAEVDTPSTGVPEEPIEWKESRLVPEPDVADIHTPMAGSSSTAAEVDALNTQDGASSNESSSGNRENTYGIGEETIAETEEEIPVAVESEIDIVEIEEPMHGDCEEDIPDRPGPTVDVAEIDDPSVGMETTEPEEPEPLSQEVDDFTFEEEEESPLDFEL